jgi:hypothetical protein
MSQLSKLTKSRATLSILQFLSNQGEVKITGLIGKVAGQRAIYASLDTLLSFGLVADRTAKEFPHPRLISITPFGKDIALYLNKIELILIGAKEKQAVPA